MKFVKQNSNSSSITLQKTLSEIKDSVTVAAGASKFLNYDVGFDPFELRTITALSDNAQKIQISLFDNINGTGNEVYRSLDAITLHDILFIPCSDKSLKKQIHLKISNTGSVDTTITFTIMVTNL